VTQFYQQAVELRSDDVTLIRRPSVLLTKPEAILPCRHHRFSGQVVGATEAGLENIRAGVRILAESKHFSLYRNVQTSCGCRPAIAMPGAKATGAIS
jgi:hypothetical protein